MLEPLSARRLLVPDVYQFAFGFHGNISRPVCMNHITLVSVTTDAKVPIRRLGQTGHNKINSHHCH